MAPLAVLRYCLAGDVEFSDILKGKQGNCGLPSKTPPLALCVCFPTRQGKLTQNLAYVFYLHRGTQINELIMNNLPASTANILFTQNHTQEYLHNQKYTCSFNYMKIMSTKSNKSTMFLPFCFKPHVSFQTYRGFQIQKLIIRFAVEAELIPGSRLTEEAKK